jgi:hypothetical protein
MPFKAKYSPFKESPITSKESPADIKDIIKPLEDLFAIFEKGPMTRQERILHFEKITTLIDDMLAENREAILKESLTSSKVMSMGSKVMTGTNKEKVLKSKPK